MYGYTPEEIARMTRLQQEKLLETDDADSGAIGPDGQRTFASMEELRKFRACSK